MKNQHVKKFIGTAKAKITVILSCILYFYLSIGVVHAQSANPFATDKIVSSNAGTTFDAQIMYYIKLGAKLTITLVMLFGIAGAIAYLMNSLKDARREGEYSGVITAIIVVFILIIVTALIANFAWSWVDAVSL